MRNVDIDNGLLFLYNNVVKYIFLLYLLFLPISYLLCDDLEEYYDTLNNEIVQAFKSRDYIHFENISNKINENELNSNFGYKFLRIKLLALTSINRYEEALKILETYQHLVQNNVELNIALGLLHYKINKDYKYFYMTAFQLLNNKETKSEYEFELEYLLSKLLKIKTNIDIDNRIDKIFIDQIEKMNESELIEIINFGYIIINPILEINNENNTDFEWWIIK
jgi:hypothetical protein